MMTRKSSLLTALTFAAFAIPFTASAQQGQPPAMPTAKMATALGVSEKAVKACLPAAPQKAEAGDSNAKPERPDATKIATCLKAENKSLTKAQVEKVLQEFAPAPPKRD
ncbi:hypothetical protein [Albirhodobacter sp. R86504]|jgi:hypothetical protein|uniref:hypothetical protein n=1 Tax=Albirhodobacter sp. R86504 TaxID=3093848 RepID=UPI00366AE799